MANGIDQQEAGQTVDRLAILDCVHSIARGCDRGDEALILSAFHDNAEIQHGSFSGSPREFVDWLLPRIHSRRFSQHFITNHLAEIDGDTAHAESYTRVVIAPEAGAFYDSGGRYIDRLERRGGAWRIAARVTIVEWTSAFEKQQGAPGGEPFAKPARDHSDPSYRRPLDPSDFA